MDPVLRFRIVFDFHTALLCVWCLKRRVELKWKREKDFFSSDFL
jgi:hypothetical protein